MKRGQVGLYCKRPRGQTGLHKNMRTDWIIQDKRRDRITKDHVDSQIKQGQ
jgi:hypothetical protein